MKEPLVIANNISRDFKSQSGLFQKKRIVRAVSDASLVVHQGETVGLVGESGSGKSTLGRIIVRLLNPTSGSVTFDGVDITKKNKKELLPFRRRAQIIFQDPYSSLNPRMTLRAVLKEVAQVHRLAESDEAQSKLILSLIERVGLREDQLNRYPHEFSGGQRQRIGIARALAVNPEFMVADEPVSALDVSVQAQIINLLKDIQEERKLAYLFISHDLRVVRYLSHRVAVMYLGHLVEQGPAKDVLASPKHPYTQMLIDAVPSTEARERRKLAVIHVDASKKTGVPSGCAFHPRCPIAKPGLCNTEKPASRELSPGHVAACHLA